LKKKDDEWRITEWHDEAFEEINTANDLLFPIVWATLKQPR